MKIQLANPRGFCAGVDRAISIVHRALDRFGPPIYVRHEVVHNRLVVADLKQRGAIFVNELDEIPDGSTVIFSAHGVSLAVQQEAQARGLHIFDATCPLVTKVHMEVAKYAKQHTDVILIGHAGHPEVEGTMGQYQSDQGQIYLIESIEDVENLQVQQTDHLAYVTQTTLSVDDTAAIIGALKVRFPAICGPRKDDICYATQNRQDAVKTLAQSCDLIFVVGSANSSNSNRLRELAERQGVPAYLIDDAQQINPAWLENTQCIGVTAGASAPETLVQSVILRLTALGAEPPEEQVAEAENIVFSLPKALK